MFDKNNVQIRVAIHKPLRQQKDLLASATVEVSWNNDFTIQICDCRYIATRDGDILFSLPTARTLQNGSFQHTPTVRFPKALDDMVLAEANREWWKFSASQPDVQHDGPLQLTDAVD